MTTNPAAYRQRLKEAAKLFDATYGESEADHAADLRSALADLAKLEAAIRWVLGEGDSDFGDNTPVTGAPRFWWRSELRDRAALNPTQQETDRG